MKTERKTKPKAALKEEKKKKRGSLRQRIAIIKLVENGGNVSKAMREAGYSKKTAINPKKLTESKAYQEILGNYLPDELLAQKHLELLNKEEVILKNNVTTGKIEAIYTGRVDTNAVKSALDMAYKLKGKYAPEKSINLNMNIKQDNPQLEKIRKMYDEEVKKQIIKQIENE